jgi:hypothetical protein
MLPKKAETKIKAQIMAPRERRVIESKQSEVEKELEDIKRKLAMLG